VAEAAFCHHHIINTTTSQHDEMKAQPYHYKCLSQQSQLTFTVANPRFGGGGGAERTGSVSAYLGPDSNEPSIPNTRTSNFRQCPISTLEGE